MDEKIERKFAIPVFLLLGIFIIVDTVYATNLYRATGGGAITKVDEWSACKKITNNNSNDLFIPTNTSAEWSAFRAYAPNVVLGECSISNVLGDLNGDGKPDLVVTNGNSNTVSVFINKGDGTFLGKVDYPTGAFPQGVSIGDLNGDGKPDLVLVNWKWVNEKPNTVSVFINKGDGTFADRVDYDTGGGHPMNVAIGDLNGDGKPDLAVANNNEAQNAPEGSIFISIFINNGDGTFANGVNYTIGGRNLSSIAIGDLNGDGKLDLAVTTYDANINTVSILLNRGNGTFFSAVDYITGAVSDGVAIGDLNGDGWPDLAVVSRYPYFLSVFMNKGNGTFASRVDYTTGQSPYGIAIGDLNGDGKLDLAVSNNGAGISVHINGGNGTFPTHVDYSLSGAGTRKIAINDFNGDGKPDLTVTNPSIDKVAILMNNGNGTFAAAVYYTTGARPSGVASYAVPAPTTLYLAISANTQNYNIYDAAVAAGWTAGRTVVLTINSGVIVGSNSTNQPALITGSFPAGANVIIINKGSVIGAGGAGGDEVKPGNNASDAVSLLLSITVDNTNGFIFGGGGGGGGGGYNIFVNNARTCGSVQGTYRTPGGGGGGGAGNLGGAGGLGGTGNTPKSTAGANGSSGGISPGNGGAGGVGPPGTFSAGAGGNGGNYGQSGSAGQSGVIMCESSGTVSGGAGGIAGKAINTNRNTITWLGGNDSAHVKGAVN